jgi:hypothetical protein
MRGVNCVRLIDRVVLDGENKRSPYRFEWMLQMQETDPLAIVKKRRLCPTGQKLSIVQETKRGERVK